MSLEAMFYERAAIVDNNLLFPKIHPTSLLALIHHLPAMVMMRLWITIAGHFMDKF
jgi:hypothetical protein